MLKGEVPIVATWGEPSVGPQLLYPVGLQLLYPRHQKRIEVGEVGQFPLRANSFALSGNGLKLFVSQKPEMNAGEEKVLFKIDLKEVQ